MERPFCKFKPKIQGTLYHNNGAYMGSASLILGAPRMIFVLPNMISMARTLDVWNEVYSWWVGSC